VPKSSPLRQLRLRLLSLLDQKVGKEKSILRRSIQALDRLIREKEPEKPAVKGYHQKCPAEPSATHPAEGEDPEKNSEMRLKAETPARKRTD
jgi:hypothetical protein